MNGIAATIGLILSGVAGAVQYNNLRRGGYDRAAAASGAMTGYIPGAPAGVNTFEDVATRAAGTWMPAIGGGAATYIARKTGYNRMTAKGVNL